MKPSEKGPQGPDEYPERVGIVFAHMRHLYGAGGGLERNRWNLANEFLRMGIKVDLLVLNPDGLEHLADQPDRHAIRLRREHPIATRIRALNSAPDSWKELLKPVILPAKGAKPLRYLRSVQQYIEGYRPDRIIGGGTQENLTLAIARSGTTHKPRLTLSEHNPLSNTLTTEKHRRLWRWHHLRPLLRRMYSQADSLVAISDAVADDLASTLDLPRERIKTVYNPVVTDALWERIREPFDHPWFAESPPPVILNVGRMTAQKDQATLIRAFAAARQTRPLRLIILGDGPERANLERLADELGIRQDIHMPGFAANPLKYMVRASVFVLTSRWEGFGNVLVEALASGCPVVATNCPGGPAEILDHGRFGTMVPSDPAQISEALLATIDAPPDRLLLKDRASQFTAARAAEHYLSP
ncbi:MULTISPECIES: glycosyltransferase [unclassified Thioalkalivibrio]|uniref:glycosyltransferase n=1 Tax=unclassified Thioalkalivibrio TaxID=2621013 RepID=UPI0012DDD205|nr:MULTISPECIES: glycosyltransferase [unclassified Thioalkalivibrio]